MYVCGGGGGGGGGGWGVMVVEWRRGNVRGSKPPKTVLRATFSCLLSSFGEFST